MSRGFWLLALVTAVAPAASLQFGGRASGWAGASFDTAWLGQAGLRYLPEAQFAVPLGGELSLDAEASVNGFVSAAARTLDRPQVEARLKPYRALVRVSSSRFEARAGLQKINFGSATLLRPLQWFDRVDPRDPLELTDGVYGLLGRYYFPGNANLWAWGLVGNSSPKGWEQFGTERWTPEFGGRVQLPAPRGELAATYHHRGFDYTLWQPPDRIAEVVVPEDRVGLDGKFDLGVGLGFEATLQRQHFGSPADSTRWQRAAMVGLDYTFGIGAGLSVLAEQMLVGGASEPFGRGNDAQLSALMLGLPLGLLDNLRAMAYYDWTNRELYSFAGWQRTLDNWVLSLSAFANPDRPAAGAVAGGAAGKGVRFDVVFNH